MAASFAPIIVTCMRPIAPAGEMAYRLKPDSADITDAANIKNSGLVSTDSVPSAYMAAFTWPGSAFSLATLPPHSYQANSSGAQGIPGLVSPVPFWLVSKVVTTSN